MPGARFGGATLRVVRLSRRTPSRSSSARTVWLRVAVENPSRFADLVKLASSATATKALSSANCVPRMGSPRLTGDYQRALLFGSAHEWTARIDTTRVVLIDFPLSRDAHGRVIIRASR